jgi:FkbM family methyltransferase
MFVLGLLANFVLVIKPLGFFLIQIFNQQVRKNTFTIFYNNISLCFKASNYLIYKRIKSFNTKEPITLKWIESIPENSLLFDIGANIGLYSIYAGKLNIDVVSFEPSSMNLRDLCENVGINNLKNVLIFPFPLSDVNEVGLLTVGDDTEGASQSNFKYGVDQNGNESKKIFGYNILSFSIDNLIESGILKQPDFIKLDVDGIEDKILFGARNSIINVRGIIIETNEEWISQYERITSFMVNSGFSLVDEEKLGSFGMKNVVWSNNRF